MTKIITKTWFNNSKGTVGVVLAENEYGQKGFISSIQSTLSEDDDAQTVLDWGSSLSQSQAKGFFGDLVDDDKYGNF